MSEESEKSVLVTKDHLQKQGEIITDMFMRVAAIERILIEKKLVTEEEMVRALEKLSGELMDAVKQKLESEASASQEMK